MDNIIKTRRLQLGLTLSDVAKACDVSESTVQRWENGQIANMKRNYIAKLSKALKVKPTIIMGLEDEPTDNQKLYILDSKKIYSIPIFENVSAGFGTTAIDEIVDYIPLYIETKEEAENTICITVKDDSMSPKIDNGDLIQVHRQTTVENGSVGVVLIDNEEALFKKIKYDKKSIDLISFNPYYPVKHFEGKELQRIQVLGLVKKVIKNI